MSDTHYQDRLLDLPIGLGDLWADFAPILHAGDVGELGVLDLFGEFAANYDLSRLRAGGGTTNRAVKVNGLGSVHYYKNAMLGRFYASTTVAPVVAAR